MKPVELKQFMDRMDVSGGQGREAIEIGFNHVNKEHEAQPVDEVKMLSHIQQSSTKFENSDLNAYVNTTCILKLIHITIRS